MCAHLLSHLKDLHSIQLNGYYVFRCVAAVADGGLGLTPADGAKMSANLVAFTYLLHYLDQYI